MSERILNIIRELRRHQGKNLEMAVFQNFQIWSPHHFQWGQMLGNRLIFGTGIISRWFTGRKFEIEFQLSIAAYTWSPFGVQLSFCLIGG